MGSTPLGNASERMRPREGPALGLIQAYKKANLMDIVYLICFGGKYKHAAHYIGWSKQLNTRLQHHRNGTGARLMKAATKAGLDWQVVRTWKAGPDFERKLHNYKNSRKLCPVCNPEKWSTHFVLDN